MNFDYDLIEKIGATHYAVSSDGVVSYYTARVYDFLVHSHGMERQETISIEWALQNLIPIPPRPQPEYKYELVTDKNFWELRKEFEAGELFISDCGYHKVDTVPLLARMYALNRVYRRKAIKRDWRDEILANIKDGIVKKEGDYSIRVSGILDRDNAIRFAKTTLKATGESL